MSDQAALAVVGVGLLATLFVATGARALREFSRHALQEVCRRRKSPERFGDILLRHRPVAQAIENFSVLLTTLVAVAGAVVLSRAIGMGMEPDWVRILLGALLLGVAISAAKLWVPWAIAELWAEPFLYVTWELWSLIAVVMSPLVGCAKIIDELLHRLAGREREVPSEESLEEEIRSIVSEGHRGGLLEEEAREMIEGVIELSDVDVSEIMTPRTDMHMIRVTLPWDDLIQSVIESGHTRIPVFDKNRDDIIGILHSKDLLPELAMQNGEAPTPISSILRKPYFVPETKAVDDLLHEFQKTGNHIAVVLDEYGGV
ncbi:MAG: CBS domain-containing protein, partial [Planctomycetales bacterium]|nr:CBS domain-containing protein [Planctomycetales bacterium]